VPNLNSTPKSVTSCAKDCQITRIEKKEKIGGGIRDFKKNKQVFWHNRKNGKEE